VAYPQVSGQPCFKGLVITPGGEPAIQGGVHHMYELLGPQYLARRRDHALTRKELRGRQSLFGIDTYLIQDRLPFFVLVHVSVWE